VPAVLLAMTLVATAFAALIAWGANQDLADVREDLDTMGGPTLASTLVDSLQDERNYATIYILGFENALQLDVQSLDEGIAATDEALAAFRSEVQRRGGDLAEAYGPVLDRIDDPLADVRQSAGSVTGERGQNQTAVSEPIYAEYTTLVDDLLDAGDSMALAIDDPELSQGVRLAHLAIAQPALLGNVLRQLLLAGVEPGGAGIDTAEEVATISATQAELEANETEIASLATGIYGDVAADREDDAALSELSGVIAASREGGVVPIAEVVTTATDLPERYAAMHDAVRTVLSDRADELENEAQARRLLWFVLTAASAAAVAVALVVLVR
jgi:Nitrate and nitrite sensing